MNKTLIPILIKVGQEEKVILKDVSSLNTESLIRLKKCFEGILYDTVTAINEIINTDVLANTQIKHTSRVSQYRLEKKQDKSKILIKKMKGRK